MGDDDDEWWPNYNEVCCLTYGTIWENNFIRHFIPVFMVEISLNDKDIKRRTICGVIYSFFKVS